MSETMNLFRFFFSHDKKLPTELERARRQFEEVNEQLRIIRKDLEQEKEAMQRDAGVSALHRLGNICRPAKPQRND